MSCQARRSSWLPPRWRSSTPDVLVALDGAPDCRTDWAARGGDPSGPTTEGWISSRIGIPLVVGAERIAVLFEVASSEPHGLPTGCGVGDEGCHGLATLGDRDRRSGLCDPVEHLQALVLELAGRHAPHAAI